MQSTRVQCMAVTHDWLLTATDLGHEIKSELCLRCKNDFHACIVAVILLLCSTVLFCSLGC